MGPNAPKMTPNLGNRFRYVKPPYHNVFGPPTPGWQRSAATLQLKKGPKMGPWRLKWPQKGPTPTSNKQVGFVRSLGDADRLRPQTWPEVAPSLGAPTHQVWAPNSRVAPVGGHITAENGQKWALGGRNGPKRGQQQQATSGWASFDISGTPIARSPKLEGVPS